MSELWKFICLAFVSVIGILALFSMGNKDMPPCFDDEKDKL